MAKLNTIRKGDRAEYITQGIFSALGYSLPFLRQEDYGLDFLCTLVENKGNLSYPTKSFIVQLKTNSKNVVYNISDRLKSKWLLENNLPFFICYFETKENRVDFFSTSILFYFNITAPVNVTKISFRMSKGLGHSEIYLDEEQLKNKIFKIDMGHPFLTISIKDLEDDLKIKNFRKILDKVLTRENENIVYRNLKLPFMRWLHNYDTNSEKIIFAWAHDERNPQLLLKSIGHIIISLCHNYKINNKLDDYQSLRKFVFRLPFNKDYKSSLITLGFRDKQGKEIK